MLEMGFDDLMCLFFMKNLTAMPLDIIPNKSHNECRLSVACAIYFVVSSINQLFTIF